MSTKQCKECDQTKNIEEFRKNQNVCKLCIKKKSEATRAQNNGTVTNNTEVEIVEKNDELALIFKLTKMLRDFRVTEDRNAEINNFVVDLNKYSLAIANEKPIKKTKK
jgi:hypothetical protein